MSPLPPPPGGIARWTRVVTQYAETCDTTDLAVINTALRWRTVQQNSTLARLAAGAPQILSCATALLRAALRRDVDVLHINTSAQFSIVRDLVLAVLARFLRIPVVYHLRFGRMPEVAERRGAEWRGLRMVMRLSEHVIAIDQRTEQVVRGMLPPDRVTRIPNCIDIKATTQSAPAGQSATAPYVLFVGWVVPAKGVEELFSAWHQVESAGWRLVVAGPYDEAYLDSVDTRPGADDSVDLLGEVPHSRILELMAGAELLVLPSHTEGFPNAVLEAMTLGRCVLATDVGAIGEMLGEGCGVLVPPRDTNALRDALAILLTDPGMRQTLGERARAKAAAEYSLERCFERYRDLWARAAGNRRRP
ncbi:glycosyltransferase family 4 protein [Krasilnikovia sp. M28-CT-15]|uniref:glycosyltransferase family 4 protein n=1 Tax=Krasilnikovia sp. M28-CT-15 TaxID=3373540 RepID=UPI0038764F31